MAWFASHRDGARRLAAVAPACAVAPPTDWSCARRRRSCVVFVVAFGQMFLDQVAQLLEALPGLVDGSWPGSTTASTARYDVNDILSHLNITPEQVAGLRGDRSWAACSDSSAPSWAAVLSSLLTFALFTFYFSADGRRLRRYVATLFPPRLQGHVARGLGRHGRKTGGYVAAAWSWRASTAR